MSLCQAFGWFNALDSRTKDWCTALMWSADIGISWKVQKGCSDKYPILFSLSGLQGNWIASGARAGCLLFFVRNQLVHVGVFSFLYAIIGFLNRDFSTNSGTQS